MNDVEKFTTGSDLRQASDDHGGEEDSGAGDTLSEDDKGMFSAGVGSRADTDGAGGGSDVGVVMVSLLKDAGGSSVPLGSTE